jgi:hypothetical protein
MSASEHNFFHSFPFKFILSRAQARERELVESIEKMAQMPRLELIGSTG